MENAVFVFVNLHEKERRQPDSSVQVPAAVSSLRKRKARLKKSNQYEKKKTNVQIRDVHWCCATTVFAKGKQDITALLENSWQVCNALSIWRTQQTSSQARLTTRTNLRLIWHNLPLHSRRRSVGYPSPLQGSLRGRG